MVFISDEGEDYCAVKLVGSDPRGPQIEVGSQDRRLTSGETVEFRFRPRFRNGKTNLRGASCERSALCFIECCGVRFGCKFEGQIGISDVAVDEISDGMCLVDQNQDGEYASHARILDPIYAAYPKGQGLLMVFNPAWKNILNKFADNSKCHDTFEFVNRQKMLLARL